MRRISLRYSLVIKIKSIAHTLRIRHALICISIIEIPKSGETAGCNERLSQPVN